MRLISAYKVEAEAELEAEAGAEAGVTGSLNR